MDAPAQMPCLCPGVSLPLCCVLVYWCKTELPTAYCTGGVVPSYVATISPRQAGLSVRLQRVSACVSACVSTLGTS